MKQPARRSDPRRAPTSPRPIRGCDMDRRDRRVRRDPGGDGDGRRRTVRLPVNRRRVQRHRRCRADQAELDMPCYARSTIRAEVDSNPLAPFAFFETDGVAVDFDRRRFAVWFQNTETAGTPPRACHAAARDVPRERPDGDGGRRRRPWRPRRLRHIGAEVCVACQPCRRRSGVGHPGEQFAVRHVSGRKRQRHRQDASCALRPACELQNAAP